MTESIVLHLNDEKLAGICPEKITLKSDLPCLSDIIVKIEVDPPHRFHSFVWSFTASYNLHGLNLSNSTGNLAVGQREYTISNTTRCWGNSIRIRVEIKLNQGSNPAPYICELRVAGQNPDFGILKKELNSSALLALVKTLSNCTMFDSSGDPLFKDGGFGLFLIKNPDMSLLFNWKKQCQKAAEIFDEHVKYWKEISGKLRAENPKYKKLEDLKADQILVAALQSWKGGNYWIPIQRGSLFKKYVWSKNSIVEETEFGDLCMSNFEK